MVSTYYIKLVTAEGLEIKGGTHEFRLVAIFPSFD